MPELSIIIPTFNRAKYLLHTVEQIFKQGVEDLELWIIDQSSEDQSAIITAGLKAYAADPRVHYLKLDTVGVANARNAGLVRVSGRIIMFLDDDVILLTPQFLRAHIDAYEDSSIGGVTGRTIERTNRENTRRTANHISPGGRTLVNLMGTERCDIQSLKGANMSVRAAAIAGMGGFDRNYIGTALLEEADFAERIRKQGWRLVFEPAAELLHLSAPSGGVRVKQVHQEYFRFRSTAYFLCKHRGLRAVVPFTAVHGLVAARKALQARDVGLPARAWRGALAGVSRWAKGFDETLPGENGVAGPAKAGESAAMAGKSPGKAGDVSQAAGSASRAGAKAIWLQERLRGIGEAGFVEQYPRRKAEK